MHISVVGAGVAGLTSATELVTRGACVTIYERSPEIGPGSCSWYAGGMLAPWCERENAEESVVTLGETAADWWDRHTGEVVRNGSLVVAQGRDHSELKRFGARTSNFTEIASEDIAALEPDLSGRFQCGLFFAEEAHLNPRKALATLGRNLATNGALFRFGEAGDVAALARQGLVLDARGLAAQNTLPELRGVKGEMLLLKCPELKFSRPIRMLHPRIPLYIVPREDGIFMVGATMFESADRARITARSMLELLGSAYALHPTFGEAEVIEIGVDARPAYPENLPRVTRDGNIVTVNGLHRHGYLLAPAMARKAAEEIFETFTTMETSDAHNR